jgi:hypothetical protein
MGFEQCDVQTQIMALGSLSVFQRQHLIFGLRISIQQPNMYLNLSMLLDDAHLKAMIGFYKVYETILDESVRCQCCTWTVIIMFFSRITMTRVGPHCGATILGRRRM